MQERPGAGGGLDEADIARPVTWRTVLSPGLLFMALLAAASGVLAYWLGGEAALAAGWAEEEELLLHILPRMAAAAIVAGVVRVLAPPALITRWLGDRSGVLGLMLAAFAGMVTPGGQTAVVALVAAMAAAGADRGALVAYAIGWALLGVHRVMLWEVPILGGDFTFLRMLVSLPVPILAGLIARLLPAPPIGARGR
jgi:uncharacterized membrane protein YraQ (UPF0718 family)